MAPSNPHTEALTTAEDDGLSAEEVQARLAKYGTNEIEEVRAGPLRGVLKRLWGPIPWMLEAALVLEIVLGKVVEPAIIGAWLLFSAVLGGFQELRARAALDLLRSRLHVNASARRGGKWQVLAARDLVPGDRIHVKTGDLIPADGSICEGMVEVDQSALTGESAAVARSKGDTIYAASVVRRGDATANVTATGSRSYYGRTAELVRSARSVGHLDKLLFNVVRYLVAVDAVLAAILLAFALWRGNELLPLVPFFMVLVTATVPVTMPAAFTAANAVEARVLARQGVLVTGLSAVQEAATMDVLCVDKTGTLTENRQTIAALVSLAKDSDNDLLAWAAATCDESTQSPIDLCILRELDRRSVQRLVRRKLVPFDPAAKRSEAVVERDGQPVRVIMGSPVVLRELAQPFDGLMDRVDELAASGSRILAIAAGPEERVAIRGLIAFADTLREDATALVDALRSLGIRVLLVSGDTLATVRAVSRKIGIGERFGDARAALGEPLQYDAFANFYPEDKLRLIEALQKTGRIAGMTGDGVNDAPALKQAEVGIAVSSASDVARASAQVVLTHPGLTDMVSVVSAGRRVYRRMLTWTITKIARTVELAALLTVGYIATGIFVTPLFLIVVIVVLNDIVTITLATDRAWLSPVPERWNVPEIAKVAGVIAAGWLVLAFAILAAALRWLHLPTTEVQTLMFVYLVYSAQATIYITRVRDRFWSFRPSRWVAAATIGNVVVASLAAYLGIMMRAVPGWMLLATLALVLAATVLLDFLKGLLFQRGGVFGASAAARDVVPPKT